MRIARLCATAAVTLMVAASVAEGTAVQAATAGGRVVRHDGAGQGPDYSTDVAASPVGDRVFVTGSTYGGPTNGDDITTIAYDPDGHPLWTTDFNGTASSIDQANALAVAPDGAAVFVTGYSWGGIGTQNDVLTIAYDAATGDVRWVRRYDGPGHQTDAGADVAVSAAGDAVFVTGASAKADGTLDVVTIGYDAATGARRWLARAGSVPGGSAEGLGVDVAPDGSAAFVTGYRTGPQSIDLVALAYDAGTGARRWARTIDAGGEEVGRAVAAAPDGSAVFVTGASTGGPTGPGGVPEDCASGQPDAVGADYITAAFDTATGGRVWLRNYDGPDGDCDEAFDVAVSPDASAVFVTGSSFSLSSDSDVATVAYEADDGATRWSARFDGPDHLYDAGNDLVVAPDGGRVIVSGFLTSAATGDDFLTLFYDAASGTRVRTERYDGPGHGFDAPNAVAAGPTGTVYVTGGSTGDGGSPDYATVIYRP